MQETHLLKNTDCNNLTRKGDLMQRQKRNLIKTKIGKYVHICLKKMNEHMSKDDNKLLSMLLMENIQNKIR